MVEEGFLKKAFLLLFAIYYLRRWLFMPRPGPAASILYGPSIGVRQVSWGVFPPPTGRSAVQQFPRERVPHQSTPRSRFAGPIRWSYWDRVRSPSTLGLS